MSSKSGRRRIDSSDSDGECEAEGRKRRHRRHHHGHRDRHHSRSRSQSRSRSPKHKSVKQERHSRDYDKYEHSRSRDPKPLKNRDHSENRKHGRHREERPRGEEAEDKHERRGKKAKRREDRDVGIAGRSHGVRNGDGNHRVEEGHPEAATLGGKWDNDPGADSPRVARSGENTSQGNQAGQVRIKQEREWNDQRRTQDFQRKPPDPFDVQSRDAGPSEETGPPPEKEKPNFGTSGKLTEDTNTYRGVVIKYNEPIEARKPKRKWRFYVFKGDEELPIVHIHRQSAYLMGRERMIADLPIDHPSCSKQHAVLQYRLVPYERSDGKTGKRVRPYIIDLESSNGTYINNNRIEPKRYYELQEKDVLKFGYSTREYVLLHDKSRDDNPDEDLGED